MHPFLITNHVQGERERDRIRREREEVKRRAAEAADKSRMLIDEVNDTLARVNRVSPAGGRAKIQQG